MATKPACEPWLTSPTTREDYHCGFSGLICLGIVVTMDHTIETQLLELEHRGWQALCDGTGAKFYGQLMTDDAVMVLAHGHAFDRDAVETSLQDAPTWDSYAIDDPTVLILGSDHAVLRYTGAGRRSGEADFVALMASVYIRVENTWRLAHYQQTPVPVFTSSE